MIKSKTTSITCTCQCQETDLRRNLSNGRRYAKPALL